MTQQFRERLENIPGKLLKHSNFVLYRLEDTGKPKPDKIPYDTKTGKRAKSNDPKTWSSYKEVIEKLSKSNGHYDGIGWEFTKIAKITGIDLDHCVKDGKIEPWAQEIINQFNSYTEFSPSGDGVHILAGGLKPGKDCRKKYYEGEIEIYDEGRFFTITGNIVHGPSLNIENRQNELNQLYDRVFGKPTATKPEIKPSPNLSLLDQEIINKAMNAKAGAKFRALWNGDVSNYGNDDSRADMALCLILAFYTGKDHNRIDSLFRQSGLYRDKWDDRRGEQTYGDLTISRAITTETYKGNGNKDKPIKSDPALVQFGANIKDFINIGK